MITPVFKLIIEKTGKFMMAAKKKLGSMQPYFHLAFSN